MLKIKNYINGELVPPASKKYLKNICPSTGENYSMIPDSDENDVNQAVAVAQQALNRGKHHLSRNDLIFS